MGNVRVHALAKELGIKSGELLEKLRADGHAVKTASSSVEESIADGYRKAAGLPPGSAAAPKAPARKKTAAKAKGKTAEAAPAPPPLPPPRPIERRAKAVKPRRKTALSAEEKAAIAERRRLRQARLRGEVPPEATAAEVATAAPAAVAEPAMEEAAVAAAGVATGAGEEAQEPTAPPEPIAEAEAPAAEAAEATEAEEPREPAGAEEETARPEPGRLTLPHVVAPAPPRRPAGPPTTPSPRAPATGRPAPSQPAARETRGPVRRIELPQQPAHQPGRGAAAGRGAAPSRITGITRTFSQKPGTGLGKRKRRGGQAPPPSAPLPAPVKKGEGQLLRLTEGVTVKELADKMDVKAKDLIRILMLRGSMVTVNQALDPDLAKTLAEEFGFAPEVVSFEEDLQAQEEEQILESEEFEGESVGRPPVITVMGHVDHGKTSLLDALRQTNVAEGEAGGITQSIGAYQVEEKGRRLTFVDTPGHEAFTTMRSRGAQVTDLVVLVVAATDSVMPQTVEAINHARAAGVPLLVAVNKIDLPNAQPERVKQDLMVHEIVVEEFGGDVVSVPVSAKTGQGISDLLDMLLLQADILELRGNPGRRAVGTVLEAGIDRGRGAFANVIVQDGTLRTGDAVIVGAEYGRVRALLDDRGERIEDAGPAAPVQLTGLNGVPKAGDRFQVVRDENQAREISEFRQHKRREAELAKSGARGSLQDLSLAIAEGETKELSLVVKADVHGAVEVLNKTLIDLSTPKVGTKIIHSGTGAITDSDVLLASASDAVIVGFNVRPERSAAELAEREKVIIRHHTVIYELTDELKKLMAGLLDKVVEEDFLGRAEVRETFKVPKIGLVAGCYVQDGKIQRSAESRLVRDGVVVWQGKLGSLRRFKEDVREVPAGMECGIGLEGFSDVKVGDVIEVFLRREIQPTTID